jgi:hypothetical protein
MLSSSCGIHSPFIELYENQRYSPLGGFSSKSLLPTDRYAFSTQDGLSGWKTIEEAEIALISLGWKWDIDNPWEVDKVSNNNVDNDGWSYSVDFSSYADAPNGVGKMGMMHFVRRRRLRRLQTFDANLISSDYLPSCDHCDLREVDQLACLFLDKFVDASIVKHPRNITLDKVIALKNSLIESLGLLVGGSDSVNYAAIDVARRLDSFIQSGKSALSMVSSALAATVSKSDRLRDLESNYFSLEERSELAKLLLRRQDQLFIYHCAKINCGSSCEFAPEHCPNQSCSVVYSRKWAEQHDLACPEKLVQCDRICGVCIPRRTALHHHAEECSLRPVQCPFKILGCPIGECEYCPVLF